MTNNLSESQVRKLKALRDDFKYFAKSCLNIRTKSGKIKPLQLNKAQKYIHEKIEEQRAKTGMVRAIVLKGRQQGWAGKIFKKWKLQKLFIDNIGHPWCIGER